MPSLRGWLDRTDETWSPPSDGDLRGPLRYLYWLARSQARRIATGALFGTFWMVALTVPPWVLARAVDDGLVAGSMRALLGWALVLLAAGFVIAFLAIGRHRTMSKVRMDASFRSVRAIMWQSSQLGASLTRRVSAGEVVTVGIADVAIAAQALTVTGPGVGAVVAYALVAVVLFDISPLLAAVVLAGVPLLAVAIGPFLQRIEHTGTAYRDQQADLTTHLVDALAGLRVLNGLGGKHIVGRRYAQHSQALVTRGYRVAGPASWVGACSTGLPALFLAAVVWLSARMAAAGTISIGDVVAVYGYVAMLVAPVSSFIESGGDLARARVAGRRIVDLLALPVPQRDDADTPALPRGGGPLIDSESGVCIRAGSFTALVSARPADALAVLDRLGHTTPDVGADTTWAGVRLGDVSRQQLRVRMVLADNEATVFAGSVREVVAGRHDVGDDAIRAALRVAVAEDIVQAMPGGLGAPVAAGASNLSGGQAQRLRLARALCANPDVLLAADPTSAVDANTEAAIVARMHAARHGRTTVVASTSPIVLDRADTVVFLVDGRVHATGTHGELLHRDGTYRRLVSRIQGGATDE